MAMNGFKHVPCAHVLGGHWWTFDRAKLAVIMDRVDGDQARAKAVAYELGNERWSPGDIDAAIAKTTAMAG
jgi:hypothetical protein